MITTTAEVTMHRGRHPPLLSLLLHAVQAPTFPEAIARVVGRPPPPGSVWIRHTGGLQSPDVRATEFSFDRRTWTPYDQVDPSSPARVCFEHAMSDSEVAVKLWPDIVSATGIRLEVGSK